MDMRACTLAPAPTLEPTRRVQARHPADRGGGRADRGHRDPAGRVSREPSPGRPVMTVSAMTVSATTISVMTVSVMTVSAMTVSAMTVSVMTVSVRTYQ